MSPLTAMATDVRAVGKELHGAGGARAAGLSLGYGRGESDALSLLNGCGRRGNRGGGGDLDVNVCRGGN